MANVDSANLSDSIDETKGENSESEEYSSSESDSYSDSDSDTNSDDSSSDSENEGGGEGRDKTKSKTKKDEVLNYVRPSYDSTDEEDNTPETNIRRFAEVLDSRRLKKMRKEQESEFVPLEEQYNFPKDPENWKEEDLKELWADAPFRMKKTGWDPVWADEEDWNVVRDEIKAGRNPTIAPFYVPYRKYYPVIPDNHHDIASPKAVIEELDRIEEFLKWVSYVFRDGSSYEGTVWDDLAHGKGVYVAEEGLVRYEGEWLRNDMEGHGVVEVDLPDIEPVPGSNLEAEMRAEGRIIKRDFMTPEDREWLEMDIEDSIRMSGGEYVIPFYENEHWVKQFGENPEKGRYRYAGQWKHGRMHGCGVYEVNDRTIYGRFYFGELLENEYECDIDVSAMHAGIAEVAAAKARMFVNKPDGMVRELRGPYSDPQHPYFYEEEDVWMAPGFINQFYEVPEYWKTYVKEVDQERQMWLNSYYKAPLRLPMPAELEYWWSKDQTREFILINKEPEPDPEDPSKLIYTDDPLILHTPSGRLINYIDDEEHGIRLFWQPPLKEGEDLDLEKVEFLPLGYDEFFGREETVEKETLPKRIIKAVENTLKPINEKLEKWIEEKKKAAELKLKLIEKELELVEAEICLEEAIEDMADELKESEKEEEKNAEMGLQKEDDTIPVNQVEKAPAEEEDVEEEDEEDDDEDEDDVTQSSFGSVIADQGVTKDDQKGEKAGKAPFSSTSLSFASFGTSMVPSRLQQSFLSWKEKRMPPRTIPPSCKENSCIDSIMVGSVSFHRSLLQTGRLRADLKQMNSHPKRPRISPIHSVSLIFSTNSKTNIKEKTPNNSIWLHQTPERDSDNIFSLQIPVLDMDSSNNGSSESMTFC